MASVVVRMNESDSSTTIVKVKENKTTTSVCCLLMVGLLISGSICFAVGNSSCQDATRECQAGLRDTGKALLITWGVISSLICCCVCCVVCGFVGLLGVSG
ncbi:MAG: hypothetical protein K1000chlam4_00424 [Chlamydiae bacterium]|nr:hypothetical protein [Chlamydiota bacterium]